MVEENKERTKNIIITKAEKGGAVVIGDFHDYIRDSKTKLLCLAHTEVE